LEGPWDIMITTEKNQSNFAKKSYDSKFMQVWLNIESYVFFNLLSKFEEKSHNIADPYNFSYFY
jgi:hypothetical protein